MQKLLIFSARMLAYMPYLMIKVLTIHYLTISLVLNNWAPRNKVEITFDHLPWADDSHEMSNKPFFLFFLFFLRNEKKGIC